MPVNIKFNKQKIFVSSLWIRDILLISNEIWHIMVYMFVINNSTVLDATYILQNV